MPTPMNENTHMVALLEDAAIRFAERERRGVTFAVGKAQICRDIAGRLLTRGGFASERQKNYADALIRWSQEERPSASAQAASARADANSARRTAMSDMVLARIAALMQRAQAAGLTFPKIRLRHGEWKIVIKPASAHGRHPGAYYVTASSATSAQLYCGRIIPAGAFIATQDCPLAVLEALKEFNADPQSVARAYGRATSHCCFCGLGLTDGRSVAMGYGPVCAENYGLPWGEERALSHVTIEEQPPHPLAAALLVAASRPVETRIRSAIDEALARERTGIVEDRPRGPAPLSNVSLDEDDEDKHFM